MILLAVCLSLGNAQNEQITKYTIEDITNPDFWTWGWCPDNSVGNSSFEKVEEPILKDKYSLSVKYHFDHKLGEKNSDFIFLTPKKNLELLGKPTKISVWIYGNESNVIFQIVLKDKDKEIFGAKTDVRWKGWQKVEFIIPNDFNFIGNPQDVINKKIDFPINLQGITLGDWAAGGFVIKEPGIIYLNHLVITTLIED